MDSTSVFKVILIGDARVGKTSLRREFMGENFKTDYLFTLGADFAAKQLQVGDERVLLQIWDIAGQKEFSLVREKYYRATQGILLIFDLTNRTSFEGIQNWIDEYISKTGESRTPIALIGNKSDLLTDERIISEEEIENFVNTVKEKHTLSYYETSAKTGENVDSAFTEISKLILTTLEI